MSIKQQILSVLDGGDILLIVPPFVTTKVPILGPYLLQAVAGTLGFDTEVLQLNLLLASQLGLEDYERICYGQPFRLLGERLFARSAHGLPPLGRRHELWADPNGAVFGDARERGIEEFEYKFHLESACDPQEFLPLEKTCAAFAEEASRVIAELEYKIVGCSTNWEQNNCCAALLERLKALRPETLTLIGGANCEGEMAEGIASLSDSFDYVFSGEGESAFAEFLNGYAAGKLPAQRILSGKPEQDVNRLPLPDYENYSTQRKAFLGEAAAEEWSVAYESSRGCWWGQCHFCGLGGVDREQFRSKGIEKALEDVETLTQRYPRKAITMTDKVMPRSYEHELLPQLSRKSGFPALNYTQRPHLDLPALIRLKQAGIHEIQPGIEALSDGLLRLMNKDINLRQNLLLLRNAFSCGIHVIWNLLWGFPGERLREYEDTLRLLPALRHLAPPKVFRHISIDRFSPYFNHPQEFQIANLRPWAVYRGIYPDSAEIEKLACRFIGDYPCETHDSPEVIHEIARELRLWIEGWQQSSLTMIPVGDFYMIYDKRNLQGKSKTHVLDREQAQEVMNAGAYQDNDTLRWAVEERLGAIAGDGYVPLVTAAPELLVELEL